MGRGGGEVSKGKKKETLWWVGNVKGVVTPQGRCIPKRRGLGLGW